MLIGFDPGAIYQEDKDAGSTGTTGAAAGYIEERMVNLKRGWMEILEKWREQRPPEHIMHACLN